MIALRARMLYINNYCLKVEFGFTAHLPVPSPSPLPSSSLCAYVSCLLIPIVRRIRLSWYRLDVWRVFNLIASWVFGSGFSLDWMDFENERCPPCSTYQHFRSFNRGFCKTKAYWLEIVWIVCKVPLSDRVDMIILFVSIETSKSEWSQISRQDSIHYPVAKMQNAKIDFWFWHPNHTIQYFIRYGL